MSLQIDNWQSLWTSQEDDLLRRLVSSYGNDEIQWQCIAEAFGGTRRYSHLCCCEASLTTQFSAKRCRERWVEYINPSLSNAPFSKEEDGLILAYQSVHGNKWKVHTVFIVDANFTKCSALHS